MKAAKPDYMFKHIRDNDRKQARAEAEKRQKATSVKTEKLRALRLAKEAEELAAAPPAKKRKPAARRKLPPFERQE
jgi:hypothetical protein